MRILIVSDTHRKNENYMKVLQMVGKVDLVIHLGDIEGSEYTIQEAAGCPVEMVSGNNDFFSDLPSEKTLQIGKYCVMITHGHHYYINMGNEMLKKEAIVQGADIVIKYTIDFMGESNVGTVTLSISPENNANGFVICSKKTEFAAY